MNQCHDPGARLGAIGPEGRSCAPDAEEGLLHGILGEPVVTQHSESQAVGDPANTVVQLGERVFVVTGDERDQSLVREVSEVLSH